MLDLDQRMHIPWKSKDLAIQVFCVIPIREIENLFGISKTQEMAGFHLFCVLGEGVSTILISCSTILIARSTVRPRFVHGLSLHFVNSSCSYPNRSCKFQIGRSTHMC